MPLVELVPAPWTKQEVIAKVRELMEKVGQSPITLRRESLGFALNRIQYAAINECWNMYQVQQGYTLQQIVKVLTVLQQGYTLQQKNQSTNCTETCKAHLFIMYFINGHSFCNHFHIVKNTIHMCCNSFLNCFILFRNF